MADPVDTSRSSSASEHAAFEPKPILRYASAVGIQAAGVGVLCSAVQNALGTHSRGAAGVLTRTGGTIGFFAGMGVTFALTESIVANQRQKDDSLNGAAGGCAAGFLAGIRARSLPVAVASCAVLGTAMGTFDYNGKGLVPEEVESKEERRKRFFKQPRPSPATAQAAE